MKDVLKRNRWGIAYLVVLLVFAVVLWIRGGGIFGPDNGAGLREGIDVPYAEQEWP